MNEVETITIKEYLDSKGIAYREKGKELITACIFNNCDSDSRAGEEHLYFDAETSQYKCFKCGVTGNIFTLCEFLGDDKKTIIKQGIPTKPVKSTKITPEQVEGYHKVLPERIKKYLEEKRGISNDWQHTFMLGWASFYGKNWIVIPYKDVEGSYSYLKLRRDPEISEGEKYMRFPSGAESAVYGIEVLKEELDLLLITEGEFDAMVATISGIPTISFSTGAASYKNEIRKHAEQLTKIKKIYVCLDADNAGIVASHEVMKELLAVAPDAELYRVDLSEKVRGIGKDITDYFVNCGGTPDELIYKLAARFTKEDVGKVNRIAPVPKPQENVSIEGWKNVINSTFPTLLFPAELSLSVLGQLLINDISNPFGLVLVGMPSSGKTITLNFFSDVDELVFCSDKFSAAAFVSNASNVKAEKLAEIDLLPKIRYKLFEVRDLATLFSKRDDDLNEALGLLTRVFDGEGIFTDSGTHGHRGYKGEYLFMFLGATTPVSPRVWKMMGNLGSRLFFYNIDSPAKTESELMEQITTSSYKQKEKKCREVTRDFVYGLWNEYPKGITWKKESDSPRAKSLVAKSAIFLARLRGVINIWKDKSDYGSSDEYNFTMPVVEQPDRLNQLFYNLSRGHAVICGRDYIDDTDLRFVVELAIQSSEYVRSSIMRGLLKNGGSLKTSQVEKLLNCSKPTALKEMEVLKILGLCDYREELALGYPGNSEKLLVLKEDFMWLLEELKRE